MGLENTPTVAMADEKPAETPTDADDAEARKAEVKARMAADAAKAAEARKKAAEELKKEEERKKEERRRIVNERCGEEKQLEQVPIEGLRAIVQEYYDHIMATEGGKYDLELKLIVNDFVINDLTQKVTDLRGKFV